MGATIQPIQGALKVPQIMSRWQLSLPTPSGCKVCAPPATPPARLGPGSPRESLKEGEVPALRALLSSPLGTQMADRTMARRSISNPPTTPSSLFVPTLEMAHSFIHSFICSGVICDSLPITLLAVHEQPARPLTFGKILDPAPPATSPLGLQGCSSLPTPGADKVEALSSNHPGTHLPPPSAAASGFSHSKHPETSVPTPGACPVLPTGWQALHMHTLSLRLADAGLCQALCSVHVATALTTLPWHQRRGLCMSPSTRGVPGASGQSLNKGKARDDQRRGAPPKECAEGWARPVG